MFWTLLCEVFLLVNAQAVHGSSSEERLPDCPEELMLVPDDVTCTKYYSCANVNGKFVTRYFTCPFGQHFSNDKQECIYEIPPNCMQWFSKPDTARDHARNRRSVTVNDTDNSSISVSISVFEDNSSNITNISYTIATYTEDFQCPSKGRFPNYADDTCSTYYTCFLFQNGTYLKRRSTCPVGSRFNPNYELCDDKYVCSRSNISMTTEASSSYCLYEEDVNYFQCLSVGKFNNLNDITCQTYFWCYLQNDTLILELKTCPSGSAFDPSTSSCDYFYECPCSNTTISTSNSFTTTATSRTCAETNDAEIFRCTSKGNFPDNNDWSCASYFQCNVWRNGSYINTKYTCPQGSYFNPEFHLCDASYICPCSNSTEIQTTQNPNYICMGETNVEDFQCTSKGRFPNYNDATCQSYFLCNHLLNGSYVKTKYQCPGNSIFNPVGGVCDLSHTCPCATTIAVTTSPDVATSPTKAPSGICIYESDPNYLNCTVRGTFPNYNDLSCKSYFLCNCLKNETYTKTKYNCPDNSLFNPSISLCDTSYLCPCEKITTTTTLTTPSETCSYESDPEYLKCVSSGRFMNYNDKTCQSYYLCNCLRNGTCIKTKYFCPKNSVFNPVHSKCDTSYVCSCSYTTIASDVTSAMNPTCVYESDPNYLKCTSRGTFANYNDQTCKSYFLCNCLKDDIYMKTKYVCPLNSFYNPVVGLCDTSYNCPCAATTTSMPGNTDMTTVNPTTHPSDTCIYEPDPDYLQCNITDTFPNYNDPSCHTYFLCNCLTNGTNIKTKHECPVTSLYNPLLRICDTSYVCPCKDTTLPTSRISEVTTAASPTNSSEFCVYESNPDYLECNITDTYPNYNDLSCQTYFLCNCLTNGTNIKTKHSCPSSSLYNPLLGVCDTSYICPCGALDSTTQVTTSTSKISTTDISTTSLCSYESDSNYFQCTSKGSFSNFNDRSCQSYFRCTALRNGTLVKYKYSCPSGSFFNPTFGLCDTSYVCPCGSTSSTQTTVTEIILTTENNLYTTTSTTGEIISSTLSSCTYENDPNYFQCSSKGSFPNLNDLTCQTYYRCTCRSNGTCTKMMYSCPTGSQFNPSVTLCDTSYICPCSTTTLVESPSTKTSSFDVTTVSLNTTIEVITDSTSREITRSTLSSCTYENDPDYFQCSSKGSFPNLNDLTCQSYYRCTCRSNGTCTKMVYTCPTGSQFNPTFSLCDASYICPCSTTTLVQSSSTETPSIGVTTVSSSTSTEITTGSISGEITTSTLSSCTYENDPNYFQCSSKGSFPNLNDLTCQSYYRCTCRSNGTCTKMVYTCPTGSQFNPTFSLCDASYICPCSTTTLVQSSSTETSNFDVTTLSSSTSTKIITDSTNGTIASSTLSSCTYESDPDYFQCSSKGSFSNLNDVTCQSYYRCTCYSNGTCTKITYNCPSGSQFNPSVSLCDTSYICPCEITSLPTLPTSEVTTASSAVNTTELCIYESDPDYLECNITDTFPNYNDVSCQTYFLCNCLTNGTNIKTKHTCPATSLYNPILGICDTSYVCPCKGAIFSTGIASEVTTSTSEISTTQNLTTTTSPCSYENDPNYFQCTTKGSFSNLNDLSCQTYFRCSVLKNGTFVKFKYSCPSGSFFNPTFGLCDTSYLCPCETLTSTQKTTDFTLTTDRNLSTTKSNGESGNEEIQTSTTSSCTFESDSNYLQCTLTGSFPNFNDLTCQTYYLCTCLTNDTCIKMIYSCPTGSQFNSLLNVCDASYICPCSSITSSGNISTETSSFDKTSITVSTTSELKTGSTNEGITSSTHSSCTYENDPDYFQCNSTGSFPNLNDLTCLSYYFCSCRSNGTCSKITYSCPTGSQFNPTVSLCDSSYVCPCSSTTSSFTNTSDFDTTTVSLSTTTEIKTDSTNGEITNSTLSSCTYENDPDYFQCNSKGGFPNLNDLTCQSYYFCSCRSNGTCSKITYSCPTGSQFNPTVSLCDSSYVCPCSSTTSSVTNTSDFDTTTVSLSTTTEIKTDSTNGEITNSTLSYCIYENDPDYFQCSSKGSFPNLNDLTCQSYYRCTCRSNGTCTKSTYNCPTGAPFNPTVSLCDGSYLCPCSSTSATETSSVETTTASLSTITKATTQTTEATTSMSSSCTYEVDPNYFQCSSKGSFTNLNDPTCQSYFRCTCSKSGICIKTIYNCPTGSTFNPTFNLCDMSYVCPCNSA